LPYRLASGEYIETPGPEKTQTPLGNAVLVAHELCSPLRSTNLDSIVVAGKFFMGYCGKRDFHLFVERAEAYGT
jgi:hypothetical protein